MIQEYKICKDCKWYNVSENSYPVYANCLHPSIPPTTEYLVSGETAVITFCTVLRNPSGSCGREAKLWEPKS